MKTLIKYFAKKYLISLINDSLELAKKKVDVDSIKTKVKNVIDFCNLLLESIEDDKLSAEECDKIINSAEKLIQ